MGQSSDMPMKNSMYALCSMLSVVLLSFAATSGAESLEKFAGTHTRVVWIQDQGDGADTFAFGETFKLMGYDSRDGKEERALLKETENFYKPIITPDGRNVVVSSRSRHKIYLVDFTEGKKRSLGKGVAVDVWKDPVNGKVWVYALVGDGPENKYFTTHPLVRFPLDQPRNREVVWNQTHLSWSNFDLSRDGKYAGGLFPWPHAGILLFEQNIWKKYGKGCWTALSPDNSAILWVFDGLHRNLNFVNPFTATFWTTNINEAPGIGGFEVYHPRWSNHVRYLTLTGPYVEGEGGNKITGGGRKVEVYLGRFSPDLQSVEAWLQLTHNGKADFYPDVWIANGSQSNVATEMEKMSSIAVSDQNIDWPGLRDNLVFFWQDVMAENKLGEESLLGFSQFRVIPKSRAFFNRFLEMSFRRSGFVASLPSKKIGAVLREKHGLGVELLYTPDATSPKDVGPIVRIQDEEDKDFLRFTQQGKGLKVEASAGDTTLGTINIPDLFSTQRPEHLFVEMQEKTLKLYVNGQLRKTIALNKSPFASLQGVGLLFGHPEGLSAGLNGSLSHVAMQAGTFSPADITKKAQMVTGDIESRNNVRTVTFKGELIETSTVPAPDSLGAYRRALVVNRYRVTDLQQGEYQEKEMLVVQWAVLDRTVLPETKEFHIGNVVELSVEKFDDHPELEGERLMMDMFDPDLELYYQVQF